MELKDRIFVGKALIDILKEHTDKLDDPYCEELPIFIKRALVVQIRMKGFYHQYNEPTEMLEQLETIQGIVKKMVDLQNSKYRKG